MSGCSDHVVRIFSVAKGRWLPETDQNIYNEQVANQTLPSQQIGDLKKSDLPGPEALNTPGKCRNVYLIAAFIADKTQ